jgi:mono/diheme cytochrome c family protein
MPGYAEQFADGDIWAVVAFIKSRWSERLLKQQETAAEAAEKS